MNTLLKKGSNFLKPCVHLLVILTSTRSLLKPKVFTINCISLLIETLSIVQDLCSYTASGQKVNNDCQQKENSSYTWHNYQCLYLRRVQLVSLFWDVFSESLVILPYLETRKTTSFKKSEHEVQEQEVILARLLQAITYHCLEDFKPFVSVLISPAVSLTYIARWLPLCCVQKAYRLMG